MRSQLSAILLLLAPASATRALSFTRADSALVQRILTAEDRRDSTAPALREGAAHRDPRIQLIALAARARIVDSAFAERSSLPTPPPTPAYPDPAWRVRYRALATKPIQ